MALLGPPLMSPPKIRLSRLRDISWSVWDPIGLMGVGQNWQDKYCRPFANEYDGYLLQAAGRLRRGETASDIAAYLADIEVEHMGLGGPFQSALIRAEKKLSPPSKPIQNFEFIQIE